MQQNIKTGSRKRNKGNSLIETLSNELSIREPIKNYFKDRKKLKYPQNNISNSATIDFPCMIRLKKNNKTESRFKVKLMGRN